MNLHARTKSRLTAEDWSGLCVALLDRADGFTFREVGDEIHIDAKTAGRRVATLEETYGPIREIVTTLGKKGFKTFKLTERGKKVAQSLAFGTPMPGRRAYRQPKLSAVEEAWIMLRSTIKIPQPFQDYSSTVSRAIA